LQVSAFDALCVLSQWSPMLSAIAWVPHHHAWTVADWLAQGCLEDLIATMNFFCNAIQVQHIHASLSGAWGGMQRVALADLRQEYEGDYRYTGKV